MIEVIDAAKAAGDTLGGGFEVLATGVPIGLGSYVQWDRKLDGRLAQALMSIPAIKGCRNRARTGSGRASGLTRARRDRRGPGARGDSAVASNQQCGRSRRRRHQRRGPPRVSVDEADRHAHETAALGGSHDADRSGRQIERSDVCAVPAAAVVGEAMVALTPPTPWSRSSAGTRSRSSHAP